MYPPSVKKNSPWHITMTYHMSSRYVMESNRDDISTFYMSWRRHDSNHVLTCNDIFNDIFSWRILMTKTSMTYPMTYVFHSTPPRYIRITHRLGREMDWNHMSWDMSWNHMSCGVSSGYIMSNLSVYVIWYVINRCHDSICHAHMSCAYVMKVYVMRICHGNMSWKYMSYVYVIKIHHSISS